jgi:hypothetical protein
VDQKRDTVRNCGSFIAFVESGWCGHRFPRLAHDPDVSGQRLEGQGLGFVERPTCRDAAREIGEADPEIAILVNDRNVIHRHDSSAKFQIGLART